MNSKELIRSTCIEFMLMTLFVFFGTASVLATGQQLVDSNVGAEKASVARVVPIAFAFGMTIMVLVYSFGAHTGGHINPAVTLSLLLTGNCEVIRAVCYWIAQFVGAVLGSGLVWGATSGQTLDKDGVPVLGVGNPPFMLGANTLNPTLNQGNGFLLEVMGTYLLCLVVHMTAVHPHNLSKGEAGPQLAPLAIGFAVFIAHVVLVPFTGCGINPARTFGPALVNAFAGNTYPWSSFCWIYYIGPMVGAALASGFYMFVMKDVKPGDANVEAKHVDESATESEKESLVQNA